MTQITQCDILRDLLPLYHDDACSEASRAAVDEHIAGCEDCRALLEAMEQPLPLPSPSLPPVSRMRQAKRKLALRTALSVVAVLTAVCLLVTGGAALYTWFEEEYPVPYSDTLVKSITRADGTLEIQCSAKRFVSVQCLFRRVRTDGAQRDIVCVMLTQSKTRRYLDWSADGPEKIALGAATGLSVSRGGLRYEACYGYEYEPELWNPNWVYPGRVTEVYYWNSNTYFPRLTDLPEEVFLQELERNGILLWKEDS